jgi:hypothetical protein
MIQDLHIVVSDLTDGTVEVLYIGTDSVKAEKTFEKTSKKHDAVRLFSYPQATRVRFPIEEAKLIEDRSKAVEDEKNTDLNKKRAAAAAANAKAKEAAANAKKLTLEVARMEGKA